MKKRRIIGIVVVLFLFLFAFYIGSYIVSERGLAWSTGRCIVSENGSYLVVFNSEPTEMHNRLKNEKLFDGLQTGDKILVLHDWILLSYPGQTGVYACFRLEEGEVSDIPERVLDSLQKLGWVTVE